MAVFTTVPKSPLQWGSSGADTTKRFLLVADGFRLLIGGTNRLIISERQAQQWSPVAKNPAVFDANPNANVPTPVAWDTVNKSQYGV